MLKKSEIILFLLILSLFVFIEGCKVNKNNVGRQNMSYLYNKTESVIHPEYQIYHISDSISRLFYKVNSSELLFARQTDKEEFYAKYSITYKLYSSYNSGVISDTGSVIEVRKSESDSAVTFIGQVDFKGKTGSNYLLEVVIKDLNKNKFLKTFLNVQKKNKFVRQNFILTDTSDNPLFRYYIGSNKQFKMKFNDNGKSKFLVKYYKNDFPIASPPFAAGSEKYYLIQPDSTFIIDLKKNDKYLKFFKTGMYHILSDTSNNEGLSVMIFYDDFPRIAHSENLLNPLRYITTKQEYDKMSETPNKKIPVDNFWLENASNQERARMMIKNFYQKVQYANEFFTSYTEGWKTDRGMIYIVFGEPNIVYKSESQEVWIYGEVNNMNSVTFSFNKMENNFSDNDYSLSRSPIYKNMWYNAVDMWRR
ncbi:MAG: GWxTD domain-containing protein [Bacteroidales bacterium]|nr:GWxTD domain-containing protein [Bacteroidales bacterium]